MSANGGLYAHADGLQPANTAGHPAKPTRREANGMSSSSSPRKATTIAMPPTNGALAAGVTAGGCLPPPMIVKSEKAQGKTRQVDQPTSGQWSVPSGLHGEEKAALDNTAPEVLLAELLPQTENLVPLAAIVERMSNYGYEALQILSETLSSLPSDQRREKIFNTAVTVQRQLAKLVALALWSRMAGDLQKARDTVGLLCEQFAQAEDAVRELTAIRIMLPQSRLRNFDLISATDVLRTGAYCQMPTVIKSSAVHEKPLDDEAVDTLAEELEDAIRLRLACHDVLPLQMSDYRIADGRAHFDVTDLFEASLTVDGPFPSGRWYLLTIKFHFKVTGAGRERFPRVPKKQLRDLLLEQVNAELAPAQVSSEANGPETDPELLKDANHSGQPPPLVKFFRHLESRALQYQLDILAFQAASLEQSTWKGHLIVERDSQMQELRLHYWSQLRVKGAAARQQQPTSLRSAGTVHVRIGGGHDNQGTARSISRILFQDAEPQADSLFRRKLEVEWRVDKLISDGSKPHFAVNIYALDIKGLLLQVIKFHAFALLSQLREKVLQSYPVLGVSTSDCSIRQGAEHDDPDTLPRLMVRLCGAMTISIVIHPVSGQISVDEDVQRIPDAVEDDAGEKAAVDVFAYSTDRLNRDPSQVVEVLRYLRQHAIAKDLEQKACFLGLEAVQRLPLQPIEYAKLGASPDAVRFLALPQCPHWYLVPQFAVHPPRVALVSTTSYGIHGQVFWVLNTLQWLNRDKVLHALLEGHASANAVDRSLIDFGLDELAHLHWYGVAVVNYFRIEQQLQAHGLPFNHTTALPPLASNQKATGDTIPGGHTIERVASRIAAIGVRATDALGSSSALVKPNIFVRLSKWWDRTACTAQIFVRLGLRTISKMSKIAPFGSSGTIEYDATSRQLTFSTPDIDNCFNWFLLEWERFSKIGMLVKAVERARRWPGGTARGWKVLEFDFHQTTFAYARGRYATVTWMRSATGQPVPENFLLRLSADSFPSTDGRDKDNVGPKRPQVDNQTSRNPHECVEAAFEQNLNMGSSHSPGFWPSFLCLLHETLPVLDIIQHACRDELTDARAPTLDLRSACWYRLTFRARYGLDVRYLAGSRFIIADASQPLLGPDKEATVGGLLPLPLFHHSTREAVTSYYTLAKQFASDAPGAPPHSGHAAGHAVPTSASASTQTALGSPPAIDLRRAVLCTADEAVVGPILSAVLASVLEQLRQLDNQQEELATSAGQPAEVEAPRVVSARDTTAP